MIRFNCKYSFSWIFLAPYKKILVVQVLVVSDVKQDLGYLGSHSRHRAWRSVIYNFFFLFNCIDISLELNSSSVMMS